MRNPIVWVVIFLLLGTYLLGPNLQTPPPSDPFVETPSREGFQQNAPINRNPTLQRNPSAAVYCPDGNRAPLVEYNADGSIATYSCVDTSAQQRGGGFWGFIGNLLPLVLLLGVWIYFIRNMQKGGGAGGMGGFGKSKGKMLREVGGRVTFADVAGVDEAKLELEEVVDYLRDPMKYTRLGGKLPKGALLVGPPGTGKTLLARAVAGEAGVPFFTTSGSDFVEMFVGVGASRVRDMFEQAKKNAPCIIFIDEIDAVGKKRGNVATGGNDEREQTLNALLVEMDGFEGNHGVVILAATNRADQLDDALVRPGRFDRQVQVPNPNVDGREHILRVHAKKVPLAPDVNLRVIARGTPGFSGAQLANVVNEAAIQAARTNKRMVTMADFEYAKDKILMGPARKNVMDANETRKTAEHEVGHALVGLRVPGSDPLYKITVIPRGGSLGVTINIPERDPVGYSEAQLRGRIAMMYGGRVAEELLYGRENITTGAANDLQQATNLARRMVTEFGFHESEILGRARYEASQTNPFGMGGFNSATWSDEVLREIDREIKKILDKAEETARTILQEAIANGDMQLLADALVEYEELSGTEVQKILETRDFRNLRPDHELMSKNQPQGEKLTPGIPIIPKPRKDDAPPTAGTPPPDEGTPPPAQPKS